MKTKILCAIAAVALVCGCAETRKHVGGARETDQNVQTGGPVLGTKLVDLPQAVRDSLNQRYPNSEVADIDKQHKDGKTVYKISFREPGKNPAVFFNEDGTVFESQK